MHAGRQGGIETLGEALGYDNLARDLRVRW